MENLKGSVDKVASSVDKVAGKVVGRDGDDAQGCVLLRIAMHTRRASIVNAAFLLPSHVCEPVQRGAQAARHHGQRVGLAPQVRRSLMRSRN
mgnify:CR=1 FL=1